MLADPRFRNLSARLLGAADITRYLRALLIPAGFSLDATPGVTP